MRNPLIYPNDPPDGYTPPFTKHSGYHFGKASEDRNGFVQHSVYVREIEARRAETGQDYNGALAGTLCGLLLERHDGGYEGFDRGDYCIRAYCWCDNEGCPWCDGCQPYFIDKATGLSFTWYKHPFRGFGANRPYLAADIEALATRYGLDLHADPPA